MASFPAVKQRPPRRDELDQNIVVTDIGGQHRQTKLLRLQEQHAVLKRSQLAIFLMSLEATQDSRQQRRSSEDLDIRHEDPMWRHGLDLFSNLNNDTRSSRIRRAQYADGMHQFLDRDGRMVDLSLRDQVV